MAAAHQKSERTAAQRRYKSTTAWSAWQRLRNVSGGDDVLYKPAAAAQRKSSARRLAKGDWQKEPRYGVSYDFERVWPSANALT